MNNLEGLAICEDCLNDKYLIELIITTSSKIKICCCCKMEKKCGQYEDLANELEEVIFEHYSLASSAERWWSSDNYSGEGDDLECIIQEILGQEIPEIDEIISYLCEKDAWNVRDGDTSFFDNTESYVYRKSYDDYFEEYWSYLVDELKTKRRFFSDSAKKLFQEIFHDVENMYASQTHSSGHGYSKNKVPVIRTIAKETQIFRARRADTYEECITYLQNPDKELSPPPSKFAQQGRMNAKGVSIFYGALHIETCIAEMRPSIGSYLVLGTFSPKRELKILDFKLLESSYPVLSYFQPDFKYQSMHKEFLRKLHKLISLPVINGHEDEYLITQVLAEYLAYVRDNNFDGISFESTQFDGGANIVLFPKDKLRDTDNLFAIDDDITKRQESILDDFGLEFISNSVNVQKTEKIKYETSPLYSGNF
ncbi:RES family NAD+ phosphorylase [Acinetobacter sp. ANC 4178]|uniref:RES family NAD+ phosphorylase n=1 Tax=Acinetobacter sp. ANC 4178 TaxID=2529839 RepID=UPI00103F8F27|nr:RES family NAD+ phosphorylase [Acinetobacter sp. ANC 4178]TCB65874.1 RES domain-containing protein [Acinetobacter sp. ANC 4178]